MTGRADEFVEIRVVISKPALQVLRDYIGRTELNAEVRVGLSALHERTGWTAEMVSLGAMLADLASHLP